MAIFGVGSSLWPDFNAAARRAGELLGALGVPLLALGEGDVASEAQWCPFASPFFFFGAGLPVTKVANPKKRGVPLL